MIRQESKFVPNVSLQQIGEFKKAAMDEYLRSHKIRTFLNRKFIRRVTQPRKVQPQKLAASTKDVSADDS